MNTRWWHPFQDYSFFTQKKCTHRTTELLSKTMSTFPFAVHATFSPFLRNNLHNMLLISNTCFSVWQSNQCTHLQAVENVGILMWTLSRAGNITTGHISLCCSHNINNNKNIWHFLFQFFVYISFHFLSSISYVPFHHSAKQDFKWARFEKVAHVNRNLLIILFHTLWLFYLF